MEGEEERDRRGDLGAEQAFLRLGPPPSEGGAEQAERLARPRRTLQERIGPVLEGLYHPKERRRL